MFYGKERIFSNNPFENKGIKKTVYFYFFEHGTALGYDMYLVCGIKNYLGKLIFSNALFFDKNKFKPTSGKIKADAIIDRSGTKKFPPDNIQDKVLDNNAFKKLCWNKTLMYDYLKEYCPTSYIVKNYRELNATLQELDEKKLIVLKPARGLKGKDIIIDYPEKIASLKNLNFDADWILQEFVDTSSGIPGLVNGIHDLRVAIVNGKIAFSHIRQPKTGSKISNVANGGSIREVEIKNIPEKILATSKKLKRKIDHDFDNPLYSIDFGMQNGTSFVFEINDTIGFPSENMKKYKSFINEVLRALAIRANR